MLVVHVDEVLDGVDVAEPDRAILAKALPIIQRIAIVAQDRRTLESLAASMSGSAMLRGSVSAGSSPTWLT